MSPRPAPGVSQRSLGLVAGSPWLTASPTRCPIRPARPAESTVVVAWSAPLGAGRRDEQTIDDFLNDVLRNIDAYWSQTFREAGLPEPSVRLVTVAPGEQIATGCGTTADDRAAFYCPADDTIYMAQVFASELYEGIVNGLPGEAAGYGRAAGDFAVAYVLAHEYAHNLQQELGIFNHSVTPKARPYELHADCWAGTWANSAYQQGRLEQGDLEEALDAALAVGDFDFGNAQHHGTPEERRDALLTGYRSGDPSACSTYLPPATGS